MRKHRRKEPSWVKLILAVVTTVQVILSLILHFTNRKDTLKVIKNNETDEINVIYSAKKTNTKVE